MRKFVGVKLASVALIIAAGCGGDKGDTGAQGSAGEAGMEGPEGPSKTGAQGSQGPQGPAGPAGEAGANGSNATGADASPGEAGPGTTDPATQYATSTKIKHIVVVFGENISFDHYFGTYPTAANDPRRDDVRRCGGHTDAEQPQDAARPDDELRGAVVERQPPDREPEQRQRGQRHRRRQPVPSRPDPGRHVRTRGTTTSPSSRHRTAAPWTSSRSSRAPPGRLRSRPRHPRP